MSTSDHLFALIDILEFFRTLTCPATFTSGKGSHVLLVIIDLGFMNPWHLLNWPL